MLSFPIIFIDIFIAIITLCTVLPSSPSILLLSLIKVPLRILSGVSEKSDALEKTVNKTSLRIYYWMTSKSDSSSLNSDTENGSKMGDFGISKDSVNTSKPHTDTGEKHGVENPVTVDDAL